MSMIDGLRNVLGINQDPEADSYVDDTEENVFPGGQGAAAARALSLWHRISLFFADTLKASITVFANI